MFEEFYEMYEQEEQEVIALINRCIGGGYNWKGKFWEMTVVTLGVVFWIQARSAPKRSGWSGRSPKRNETAKMVGDAFKASKSAA